MAIRAGVPIVPIASVGGRAAMPVLVRGEQLSRVLCLDKPFRLEAFRCDLIAVGYCPGGAPAVPICRRRSGPD
jgi:1-acyl-sn-glycerol-3-phosphate acyltransferase